MALCLRLVPSVPSSVRGTPKYLQEDAKQTLRMDTGPGSPTAITQLLWLAKNRFLRLRFGMVSWKDLLWSGVGGEQWAARPEISDHDPAAPKPAQIPGLEGRRKKRRSKATCKVLQSHETPARMNPKQLL